MASIGLDKLIIALAIIGGVIFLTATNHIGNDAAIGMLSAILGYVFGKTSNEAIAAAAMQAANDTTNAAKGG